MRGHARRRRAGGAVGAMLMAWGLAAGCSSIAVVPPWTQDTEVTRVIAHVAPDFAAHRLPYRVAVAPVAAAKSYLDKTERLAALEASNRSALAWEEDGLLAASLRGALAQVLFPLGAPPAPDRFGGCTGGLFERTVFLAEPEESDDEMSDGQGASGFGLRAKPAPSASSGQALSPSASLRAGSAEGDQTSASPTPKPEARSPKPDERVRAQRAQERRRGRLPPGAPLEKLLQETRWAGCDLLLRLTLEDLEIRFMGRDEARFWLNAFTWLWSPVPGWWIADERYRLHAVWKLALYNATDNREVYVKTFAAEHEAALDDFDRGWKFADFLLFWPGAGDWPRAIRALWPTVARRLTTLALRDLTLDERLPKIEQELGTLSDGKTPVVGDPKQQGRLRVYLRDPRCDAALRKSLVATLGLDDLMRADGHKELLFGAQDAQFLHERLLLHRQYRAWEGFPYQGPRELVFHVPSAELRRSVLLLDERAFNDTQDADQDGDPVGNPDDLAAGRALSAFELDQWRARADPPVRTLPGLLDRATPHDWVLLFYSGVLAVTADKGGAVTSARLLLPGANLQEEGQGAASDFGLRDSDREGDAPAEPPSAGSGSPGGSPSPPTPKSEARSLKPVPAVELAELGRVLAAHARTRRVILLLDVALGSGGDKSAPALFPADRRAALSGATDAAWRAYLDRVLPPQTLVICAGGFGEGARVYGANVLGRSLLTHALAESWEHDYLPQARFEDVTAWQLWEVWQSRARAKVIELSTTEGRPQHPWQHQVAGNTPDLRRARKREGEPPGEPSGAVQNAAPPLRFAPGEGEPRRPPEASPAPRRWGAPPATPDAP